MIFRLDAVSKALGGSTLLDRASWQLNPGQKVGLVGRNGAGKTTLLRLIEGELEPDQGTIHRAKGVRLGYLPQLADFPDPRRPLVAEALSVFTEAFRYEQELRALEQEMTSDHSKSLLQRYSELQERYERAGGYSLHTRAEAVLQGIGFAKEDLQRPVGQLSGGQKSRVLLAKALLGRFDVLLLDEPTNYLDIAGIEWLEAYLRTIDGAYIVVSHDRRLLDRVAESIVELAFGALREFPGNYSQFVVRRQEILEIERRRYQSQQAMIRQTEHFIRKNLAGQKTKQAQSRRKMLEKLDRLGKPKVDDARVGFRFEAEQRSGDLVLQVTELACGYPGATPLVAQLSFTLLRGQRLAIVGPNGSGKTTLLRTLAGRLAPRAGLVHYGAKVTIGTYDQELGDLDPRLSVIDEIAQLDPLASEGELRDYLARFGFYDDDPFKPVAALSGGERGRLSLAKVMRRRDNLLLLDEPTNHLDVYSREALEQALMDFDGTAVLISHDRYFLDRIVNTVLTFGPESAELFPGSYSDFLARQARATPAAVPPPLAATTAKGRGRAAARRPAREPGRPRPGRPPEALESEIIALEERLKQLAAEMGRPQTYREPGRIKTLQSELSSLEAKLKRLYQEYDALSA